MDTVHEMSNFTFPADTLLTHTQAPAHSHQFSGTLPCISVAWVPGGQSPQGAGTLRRESRGTLKSWESCHKDTFICTFPQVLLNPPISHFTEWECALLS